MASRRSGSRALVWGSALVLSACGAVDRSAPLELSAYEADVFSQSGEDGVIAKIFEIVPPTRRFAVEFGAHDGIRNSNTRRLIVEEGWAGLQIEGDPKRAEQLAANYRDYPNVTALEAWVYPGNIEILFEEHAVPVDLDLLVIDIDSNDYYVWRAIQGFRPKLVLIEYNTAFAPPARAVVDFHPMNYWDGTDYHGASIQSLYELGKRKDYELVYASREGDNLYFVDAVYASRFAIPEDPPAFFYRPPRKGVKRGGRAPTGRGHMPFEKRPFLKVDAFRIQKKMVER